MAINGGLSQAVEDVLTRDEARSRASRVSDVSYELTLSFTAGSDSYRGESLVRFRLKDANAPLRLDLRSARVARLLCNGREVPSRYAGGTRLLLPAEMLAAGENRVEVGYENRFDLGSGVYRSVDPADKREYIYTDFEPFFAHRLMPCFDQPDLKATLALGVVAPRSWMVIGNSPERSSSAEGNAVHHVFEPTPKLSTYLFFVGAGPFSVYTDEKSKLPSRLLMRRSMARYVDAEELFDITRRGLEFYTELFGRPYPFAKYDQLFVPDNLSGAMENPGAITYQESFLFRHAPTVRERLERAEFLLHEMAHQWFGNLVTMRWWDGLWLNESFATYVSDLALVEATRFKEAFEDFLTSQKAPAYRSDQLPTTHPVAGEVSDTDTAFSNFDDITYAKGASVLKQLAFFMGQDCFRQGLRIYFGEHSWGNTDTDDFFAALGKACKEDLREWRRLHLETSGVNTIVPHLKTAAGKVVSFELQQLPGNGDRVLRPHRLEVAFYTAAANGSLALQKSLPVLLQSERVLIDEAAGLPAPAFVWANHGDQAYARVFLDPGSLEFARARMEKLPDALTRRGIWMTLWEMVRDGALAPGDYLDTFIAKAPLEEDAEILEGLFADVLTALNHYLASGRDACSARLEELAWLQLERAKSGSDRQKAWFDLAIDVSSAPSSLARIEKLLDAREKVAGLELDIEKQWDMVARLASFGRPGVQGRIKSLLKKDETDAGRRSALRAEAALPEREVKERFWKRLTEDSRMTVDHLRAAAAGMIRPHQVELYRPFVERYFDAVVTLRGRRGQEFVDTFARMLFPWNVHEQSVLDRAKAFLEAHPGLPLDTRRPMLEAADELARCLRLRVSRAR